MVARVDHLTVVAPSLEAGAAYVEAALGLSPGPGRKHPGMGTHNLLLALGPDAYLEVISVDPQAFEIQRPRWFGLDHVHAGAPARLAAWVARTDAIASAATPELGEIQSMRRDQYSWEMTVTRDGSLPLGGAAPLLIQRQPNVDPVAALPPRGCVLERLRVRHPAPSTVLAVLARMDLVPRPPVIVEEGDECTLVAEIRTPSGWRLLGGP